MVTLKTFKLKVRIKNIQEVTKDPTIGHQHQVMSSYYVTTKAAHYARNIHIDRYKHNPLFIHT